MTVIVGIEEPGSGAILAADSVGSDGHRRILHRTPKLHQYNDHVAIGCTTSWRWTQIAAHHLEVDDLDPTDEFDAFRWAVSVFVPALREASTGGGWTKKDSEREQGGEMVLAVRDRVFAIQEDFSVIEHMLGFITVGSGLDGAHAALLTLHRLNAPLTLTQRATLSLEVAQDWNVHVGGPWHFVRTRM